MKQVAAELCYWRLLRWYWIRQPSKDVGGPAAPAQVQAEDPAMYLVAWAAL